MSLDNLIYIRQLLTNNAVCIGKEIITVDNTVKNLTVPENATYALIVAESSVTSGTVMRYWEDGSIPTSTDGIPRSHDSAWDISTRENLIKFKIIQSQSGTHKIFVQYYK
jgi:hypothetical protein